MAELGDDIDRLFMCGTRATFTLKEDAKVDAKVARASLEKALKKKRLTFESLDEKKIPRAAAAYVAKTPGLT